ncbi:MFS transporter [Streptosporangiaceae bacterium NEAU-GS5]|nr:MFS transporter [Streptosporangiaceae bacterium NEAU-GS5]
MAHRWKVLVVTSVAVFMALLDVTIVNIAFPDIRRAFPGDTLADLSWVLNAYNVLFAAVLVPAGRLADRIGRKRVFLAGIAVFLAASVVCGLAVSAPMLIAGRAVQALGAAALMPTSLALTLPEFPPEQRGTATALATATGAVAAAFGPTVGGLLVEWQGWRLVFFVNLLIGIPALIPAVRMLREGRDESATAWPDALGAALLAGGVGALALGIVKGEDWGWSSGATLASFAAAVVLLALFAVRSARHVNPVLELALFRIRSFGVAGAGSLVFGIGFFAFLLCNVLFLTTVWHYSILTAGLAVTPGPIMVAAFAPLSGRLADRFGPRVTAVPGGLLFAAGNLLLMSRMGATPHYWSDFVPAVLVTGTGIGLTLPAFTAAAVANLPRARFATGIAVATCLRQIGAVLGVATLVALLGRPDVTAFHNAWTMIALTGALAALVGVALGRVTATAPTLERTLA